MIKVENISKKYQKRYVLNEVNMSIPKGMIGLLGKNGAGKTTLMRILAGILQPDEGEIVIENKELADRKKLRQMVGYLPQEFSFYPDFTCYEMLDYLGILDGLFERKKRNCRILDVLEKVHLLEQINIKTKNLSGGMKRRLGLAQALLSEPEILIVDEPTAGLDPEERVSMRNMLSVFAKNRTVLLSTHIVADIAYTCNYLAVMKAGKIIYQGNMEDLLKRAEYHVWKVLFEKQEWERIQQDKEIDVEAVQSIREIDAKIEVRVVSEKKPCDAAENAEVGLEEAYLYITMSS